VLTTPLNDEHVSLAATFTDFGGWNMPVRYGSDLDEHHAVRNSAGLFDISHMGELRIVGEEATKFLDKVLVSDISKLSIGQAKYTMICSQDGGIIDDLIVYKMDTEDYLVVANASNRHAVLVAMQDMADYGFKIDIFDETEDWALVAIQGPKAKDILAKLVDVDLSELKYYSIAKANLEGVPVLLARTGYTGEDGFEIFIPVLECVSIWRKLLAAGGADLLPCGLAARDTLRLEAGMPLYGHEMHEDINPYQAGFGKVVRLDEGHEFVGREALEKLTEPKERLVGLVGEGKRAARADYELKHPSTGETIGVITSGALSPTLGHPVAMAYIRDGNFGVGDTIMVDVRGNLEPYKIVKLPFYKREH
jgi:aminomethyltransferase